MLSAAAVVLGRYLWIASTVCVGNANIRKAEAITPIAMPIAIFNIRTPQSEQSHDRCLNEVADDGKPAIKSPAATLSSTDLSALEPDGNTAHRRMAVAPPACLV